MKFCYIDESGAGSEPFLVMVGVVVDGHRMHKTKEVWNEFLEILSNVCKRKIDEFHACDCYAGNGPWRGMDGPERAETISAVLSWWGERKHHLTFTVIDKLIYEEMKKNKEILDGCDSVWRTAAIHTTLSVQKMHQGNSGVKGHTLLLFDNKYEEEKPLSKFISSPPDWVYDYYGGKSKNPKLNQIIDVPFFGDSEQILLLQVADLIAFVLRRYVELTEGRVVVEYKNEPERLRQWIALISSRSYPASTRWPSRDLTIAHKMFHKLTPESIKCI